MTFIPNQRVVCVDASPGGWPHSLVEGEVYTVRKYDPPSSRCVRDDNGVLTLELCDAVWLWEPMADPSHSFRASRFRPLPPPVEKVREDRVLEPVNE